ncbi:hypothetical protein [Methylorubrum zatmanii]
MSKSNDAGFPALDPDRIAEHTKRFIAGLDRQEQRQREFENLRTVRAAGPALLAALRAILPYAESRLEDMEEHAREVADDPRLGPQADADVNKARDAFQAAQDAISAAEGRR